jgi:DNA-binding response OmpR family regulator
MCAECDELREEIIQLKAKLYGEGWEAPEELGLTPGMRTILQMLFRHERVISLWLLYDATRTIPSAKGEEVSDRIIYVWVSKLRSKLKAYGMDVENVHGRGYRLPDATRARLQNWNVHPLQSAA